MTHVDVALAVPGALVLILALVPALRKPFRTAWSARLAAIVKAQLPWVAWAQSFRCKTLDVAVQLSAFTVSIEWYLFTCPLVAWAGHPGACDDAPTRIAGSLV